MNINQVDKVAQVRLPPEWHAGTRHVKLEYICEEAGTDLKMQPGIGKVWKELKLYASGSCQQRKRLASHVLILDSQAFSVIHQVSQRATM